MVSWHIPWWIWGVKKWSVSTKTQIFSFNSHVYIKEGYQPWEIMLWHHRCVLPNIKPRAMFSTLIIIKVSLNSRAVKNLVMLSFISYNAVQFSWCEDQPSHKLLALDISSLYWFLEKKSLNLERYLFFITRSVVPVLPMAINRKIKLRNGTWNKNNLF